MQVRYQAALRPDEAGDYSSSYSPESLRYSPNELLAQQIDGRLQFRTHRVQIGTAGFGDQRCAQAARLRPGQSTERIGADCPRG